MEWISLTTLKSPTIFHRGNNEHTHHEELRSEESNTLTLRSLDSEI
ncbi:mCG1049954 [Mus musculus]|nr:mCG1049954 [Mus musculus]